MTGKHDMFVYVWLDAQKMYQLLLWFFQTGIETTQRRKRRQKPNLSFYFLILFCLESETGSYLIDKLKFS